MRRFLLIVATTLALSSCSAEQLKWFATTTAEEQAPVIDHIITEAAERHDVDPQLMLDMATCESGSRWWARNTSSAASGLFQFLPSTWANAQYRYNEAGADVMDPLANADAAASMISEGGISAWDSSKHCWSNRP